MRKTAIITGASGGIGAALVKAFAESGYDIWACARSRSDAFEENLRRFEKEYGGVITSVYFDLSDDEQIKEGIKAILREKRNVDVLINNAGIPHSGQLATTPLSKMREVYEINVFAQTLIMQLVSRQMIRQKGGCIINMCSVGGIETQKGYFAYGSSKAALIWITKEVAHELGPYNIRVNGIAPGLIDTKMGHFKSEEQIHKTMERTSLGRFGTPEEIAEAALFIASDKAPFMTGHIMVLDGGRW